MLFDVFYENDVIAEEAFKKWRYDHPKPVNKGWHENEFCFLNQL
jgi:hypothetical protein